ncbi:MAG: hypothetical protein LIO65_10295, partial [Odoribacter sp.]|nr:hypothetical protein [Odoribacter sp.]
MKASSLILPSLSQISISTKIKPLFWVYLIAIVEGALYLLFDEPHIGTDTWSYIEAWNTISQGHLSVFRTPVYPIFLGFLQRIFGDNNIFWPVTIIQYGVMLLSIKYFFRTTGFLMYSMNKRIFICLLYVLHPTIFQWATYIQTEAFATAGIVFLLFIMGKTWSINAKFHQYIILGLLSSLLILLRPGFICLIPILIIYSIILSIKHNQRCIIYFLPTIITLSLVLGYGLCYKKSFGIFGLSNVSTYNQH